MSIATNPCLVPVPLTGFQVFIHLNSGGRVVAQVEDVSQQCWILQVHSAPPDVLEPGLVANITYADGAQLYCGTCKVQSVAQDNRRLVIKKPTWFKSRPMRRFERYAVNLPVALVVTEGNLSHYIERSEARVINISEGGVLVGLRQPLPAQNNSVSLLIDTAQLTSGVWGHAYFTATPVRLEEKSPDQQFPHAFGMSFGEMQPLCRQILEMLIDKAAVGKSRQVSLSL